jgi:type IV pilus assembly protein PilA
MTTAQLHKSQKGFTLIELLVVIGILAILLAIVLIAINPARQFAQANNTKRASDVNSILNAIGQYAADHKGALPANMPAAGVAKVNIKSGAVGNVGDICSDLVTKYLAALPGDPTTGTGGGANIDCSGAYDAGYQVSVSAADNRVTIQADNFQAPATTAITATR